MGVNKHNPIVSHGSKAVTGSASVDVTEHGLRKVVNVMLTQAASLAADVNKAPKASVAIAADGKSFTIYAWKHTSTSNPTLIAATEAATFSWLAIGE